MTDAVAKKPAAASDHTEGMSYLSTLPKRVVNVYMPLSVIVVVLLFPFYWMVMTAVKPKEHLLDLDTHNPYYTLAPTFEHIRDLLCSKVGRSEEHTSELQSQSNLVCRLLLEKKKKKQGRDGRWPGSRALLHRWWTRTASLHLDRRAN